MKKLRKILHKKRDDLLSLLLMAISGAIVVMVHFFFAGIDFSMLY